MSPVHVWQEYDCPDSLIDFDLSGNELLFLGQRTFCPACGAMHQAGPDDVINQTTVDTGAGLHFFGIPKDRDELARWIEQATAPGPQT